MCRLDSVGRAEKEARLACLDHSEIVEAVAARDGFVTDGLQSADGGVLRLFAAHLIACYLAVRRDLEGIAEDGGHAELLHKRHCELLKGIAENDDLGERAELVKKLARAGHNVNTLDDLLYLGQTETVLAQDVKAVFHQLIVIGLVAGGAAQLGNAACIGKGDPYLGDKYPLHVKAYNVHFGCSFLG